MHTEVLCKLATEAANKLEKVQMERYREEKISKMKEES